MTLLLIAALSVISARPVSASAASAAPGGATQSYSAGAAKLSGIKEIVASSGFWGGSSFALKQDGTVWVWGSNFFGQFARGTSSPDGWIITPLRIAALDGMRQLLIGNGYYAALSNDGSVRVWGGSLREQADSPGGNTRVSTPQLVPGLSGVVKLAAGDDSLLALRGDGRLMQWEAPESDGSDIVPLPAAKEISGITGVKEIASGAFNAALRSDGTLWLWTSADKDQGPAGLLRTKPAQIAGLYNVKSFSLDGRSLIALTGSGSVWATSGVDYEHFLPQTVKKMSRLSGAVSAETKESLNLVQNGKGEIWVWESGTDQRSLQKVTAVPQAVRAALIPDGIAVTQKNGVTWNMGRDYLNETLKFKRPWQIKGLLNPVAFASGEYSKYAILKDGTAVAWGTNRFGQLGISTVESRPFTASPILKPVTLVVAGRQVETEQAALLQDNRVMVPVRAFAESLGYTVTWDNGIKLEQTGRIIRIQGEQLTADGKTSNLTPVPVNVGYTLLAPAGPLATALGASAKWDSVNFVLTITPKNAAK